MADQALRPNPESPRFGSPKCDKTPVFATRTQRNKANVKTRSSCKETRTQKLVKTTQKLTQPSSGVSTSPHRRKNRCSEKTKPQQTKALQARFLQRIQEGGPWPHPTPRQKKKKNSDKKKHNLSLWFLLFLSDLNLFKLTLNLDPILTQNNCSGSLNHPASDSSRD